jgi:hypothetical protein
VPFICKMSYNHIPISGSSSNREQQRGRRVAEGNTEQ